MPSKNINRYLKQVFKLKKIIATIKEFLCVKKLVDRDGYGAVKKIMQ